VSWLRALPLVLIVGAAYFLVWANLEHNKLKITVESGRILFEPAYIRLRVRVEPDPQNRALAMGIVGDSFETSSLEQLEGDRARITRWVDYKDVPAGDYTAVAQLLRVDGTTETVRDSFQVIGRY